MKISESTVVLSSYHAAEGADLIKEESHMETRSGGRPRGRTPQNTARSRGREELPPVWMDRVTISGQSRREIQSEYNAGIASGSTVRSGTGGEISRFSHEEVVKRVVGEVMDREVTIQTLEDGDDIRSGNIVTGLSSVRINPLESLLTRKSTEIHFEEEQMGFSSRGRVITGDGREIDFSLDLNMDRAFLSRTEEETLIHTWQVQASLVDPLVISLDGSVTELTDTRFEFDLDNDGTAEEISFVSKGSGFLSFDRNNDGIINNGSELFGPGTGNGFGELAEFDLDGNGWIDENDAVFSQLSVWTRDDQGNDVLVSLKEAGLGAIYLDNAQAEFDMTTMDNELKGQVRRSGVFLFENGNVGTIQQIDLAARPIEQENQDLSVGGGAPESLSPAVGGGGTVDGVSENDAENPLQALMEKIKALREEIRQILGTGKRGRNRFRNTLRTISFSDAHLYNMTRPDPTGYYRRRSSLKA